MILCEMMIRHGEISYQALLLPKYSENISIIRALREEIKTAHRLSTRSRTYSMVKKCPSRPSETPARNISARRIGIVETVDILVWAKLAHAASICADRAEAEESRIRS